MKLIFLIMIVSFGTCYAKSEVHIKDWHLHDVTLLSGIKSASYHTFKRQNLSQDASLILEKNKGDCDTSYVRLTVVNEKPSGSSFMDKVRFGEMRVDKFLSHKLTYQISFEKGNKTLFVSIISISNADDVVSEMKKGSIVRFKFDESESPVYFNFSLLGLRDIHNKAIEMCYGYGGVERDSQFF